MNDRSEMMQIAADADGLLNDGGHIMLLDFCPPFPYKNSFYDQKDNFSYKIDNSKMFLVNPNYSLVSFDSITHHQNYHDDDINERLGVHLLKKCEREAYSLTDPFKEELELEDETKQY